MPAAVDSIHPSSKQDLSASIQPLSSTSTLRTEANDFHDPTTPAGLLPADFPPLAAPTKPISPPKDVLFEPIAPPSDEKAPTKDSSSNGTQQAVEGKSINPAITGESLKKEVSEKAAAADTARIEARSPNHSRQKSEPVSKPVTSDSTAKESSVNEQPPKLARRKSVTGTSAGTAKNIEVRSTTVVKEKALAEKEAPVKLQPKNSPATAIMNTVAIDTSRPSSSGTSSSQATVPAPRNPRTLRLVPATSIEIPPKPAGPPPEVTAPLSSPAAKTPSKTQITSSAKQGSTPVNEMVSDTASLTSASQSRPPSPPFGKSGTVTSSQKSKNQAKKDRAAWVKQIEEAKAAGESTSNPIPEEVVQAPIVGRKKKSKKPKATPAISRATESEVSSAQVEDTDAREKREQEIEEAVSAAKRSVESKEPEPRNAQEPEANNDATDAANAPSMAPPRTGINAALIFPELKKEGIISSTSLDMFLNPTGVNTRLDAQLSSTFDYSEDTKLSPLEKRLLNKGQCITKRVNPREWAVILPDRSILRHFSQAEAERYVQLRNSFGDDPLQHFNSPEFPAEAWLSFTSNDLLSGCQVAPPILDSEDEDDLDPNSPEALIREYKASMLRPDSKGAQYATLYPPRTQSENDEIEARIAIMTSDEAEQTLKASEDLLAATRKEAEGIEKKLNQMLKKNRKILKDWL